MSIRSTYRSQSQIVIYRLVIYRRRRRSLDRDGRPHSPARWQEWRGMRWLRASAPGHPSHWRRHAHEQQVALVRDLSSAPLPTGDDRDADQEDCDPAWFAGEPSIVEPCRECDTLARIRSAALTSTFLCHLSGAQDTLCRNLGEKPPHSATNGYLPTQ